MSVGIDKADGNGLFRWVVGGLVTALAAVLGILWHDVNQKYDTLTEKVEKSTNSETRAVLDERSRTWIPVIQKNHEEIATLKTEVGELNIRIAHLERELDHPRR